MKTRSSLNMVFALAAFGGLFVATAVYAYLYYSSGTLTQQAIAARDAVVEEERGVKDERSIRLLSQTTAEMRSRLPGYFVPLDDAVVFIQDIEAVGSRSGATVAISSIAEEPDADSGAAPGTIGTIEASVSATGSWTAVMKALELFEALPYHASVDQAALDTSVLTGEKAAGRHDWRMTLRITAATLARPPQPPADETSTTTPS